jgi:hypothetical protein
MREYFTRLPTCWYMKEPARQPSIGPAQQADHILKAWICQDTVTLREELQRGLDLCCVSEVSALEDEHLELLQTVAARLNQCAPLRNAQPPDPVVGLCLNLLLHLAAQTPTASRFTAESQVPTTYRC